MNIDWTKIDGYREDMTADEKLELLNSYEADNEPISTPGPAPAHTDDKPAQDKPNPAKSSTVSKALYDKTASELAALKKQIRSRMTEDEQKEADRKANEEAMRAELDALRHEKTISTYKAAYLSLGYDDKLASDAASAMTDGDMDTVFAIMKQHSVTSEKALKAKLLKEMPTPPAGGDPEAEKQKKQMADLRKIMGLPV